MSQFQKMEQGRDIWKRDNLMIAAVDIIKEALFTTSPLTRQGLIKTIQEECTGEPKTFDMVMTMLANIWNGIKFEE